MTLTAYPNGVSSFGLPVIGGRFVSTGKALFVDSNTGSDSYNGRDKVHPKDSIANALAVATSEDGDVIYVMPGHAETLSTTTACQVQKSCIKLIGLGHGSNRPQLTFGSSGSISVESDNFYMENFLLLGGDTAIKPIAVKAKDCIFRNLEWRETTTTTGSYNIIECTSDVAGFELDGFKYFGTSGVSTGDAVLKFKTSSTNTERFIVKNVAVHAHDNATAGAGIIHCDSSTPPLGLLVQDCVCVWGGASTGGFAFKWGSTALTDASGVAIRVHAGNHSDGDQGALFGTTSDPDDLLIGFFDCYSANLPAEAGGIIGITTATSA